MIKPKERRLIKTEALVAIRGAFQKHHAAHVNATAGIEIDVDPLLGMVPALIELIEQNVIEEVAAAKKWLLDLVIQNGKAPVLITVKDAVIYVLTVLDALIAGKEVKNA